MLPRGRTEGGPSGVSRAVVGEAGGGGTERTESKGGGGCHVGVERGGALRLVLCVIGVWSNPCVWSVCGWLMYEKTGQGAGRGRQTPQGAARGGGEKGQSHPAGGRHGKGGRSRTPGGEKRGAERTGKQPQGAPLHLQEGGALKAGAALKPRCILINGISGEEKGNA